MSGVGLSEAVMGYSYMISEAKTGFIPRMDFHKRNKEKGDTRNRKLSGTETKGKARCWGGWGLGTTRVML